MGLQIRVSHALGARMVEVEPRGPRNPIVIGRTPKADVQVPIGTVAPAHCVLYMEQEQWIVQDNGSSGGTFVNGNPISGPVYVQSGDVLTLGESEHAPRIEIDPMGIRRGQMAMARPSQPTEQEPQEFYENPPKAAVAQQSDWPHESDEDAMVDIGGAAAGAYHRRRPVRKPRNYIAITIVASLAIIVIGWIIVAQVMKEDQPKQAAQPPQEVYQAKPDKSIFAFPQPPNPKAKTQPAEIVMPPLAVAPVEQPPKPAPVETDPEKQTDEWKALLEANAESERPAKALWTIIDYRRLHPGKFEAELKQYEDAAFDRLWWDRIAELLELQKSLETQIAAKNSEIAQETEAAYKQKLQKELEVLSFRRQRATEALTGEMGYTAKQAPNQFDAAQLAALRRQRTPEIYEAWKKRVISSLLRTRALPWEQTR